MITAHTVTIFLTNYWEKNMSRIMWSQTESMYRGQSLTGTVITIDEDALSIALKNAGNAVFDTDWWLETLTIVLERWGLNAKQWTDPATQVLRIHFRVTTDQAAANGVGTGPLTARIASGNLASGGLNSGNLSGNLRSGGLSSGSLNSGKLNDKR